MEELSSFDSVDTAEKSAVFFLPEQLEREAGYLWQLKRIVVYFGLAFQIVF